MALKRFNCVHMFENYIKTDKIKRTLGIKLELPGIKTTMCEIQSVPRWGDIDKILLQKKEKNSTFNTHNKITI